MHSFPINLLFFTCILSIPKLLLLSGVWDSHGIGFQNPRRKEKARNESRVLIAEIFVKFLVFHSNMKSAVHDPDINKSNYPLGRSFLEKSIKHYSNFHEILLVGEGDFSFSSALATAFGSAENMVPTSLNSREEVLQLYKSAHEPLSNLEKLGATILHKVDATTMEKHHIIRKMRFHRIVYNFPHAGFHGKEKDVKVIQKHRHLLKMFFQNARTILRETGEIHVTHKAYGPYKMWDLVKLAEQCGLRLKESVHFAIADYPGYTNRRGAGRNAGLPFSLGECRTYKFVLGTGILYQRKSMAKASAENFRTTILALESEIEMQTRMSDAMSTGEEDKDFGDSEDGDLEAAPVVLPTSFSEASKESLREALLELESEKKARKAAETSEAEMETAYNHLRETAYGVLMKRDEFARQRDDALHQKDEATKALESLRSEIEAAAQMLINGTEKVTSRVSAIKSFGGGLPRNSKHSGLVAIGYGATKRAEEIIEELLRQIETITKGRNDVREQMKQKSYQIAIEVSQLEAAITGLRKELGSKCIESDNLQKLVLAKDGRISELESEISENLDGEEKEYHILKRNANETEEKLKTLELKIEKQKPILYDQLNNLNHIYKAQECLQEIITKMDGSAYDQSEFSEPLFVSQDLDIGKDLVASLTGAAFVSELATVAYQKLNIVPEIATVASKKINIDQEEKRDISTLIRSALGKKVGGDKDLPRRNGAILDVAKRGLQNAGLDFRVGGLVGDPEIVVIHGTKKGEESFGLASQLEIAELRRTLKTLRAELDHLRVLSETQTKDLAEKTLHIQELEEKERTATKNVEGHVMDIVATDIARWREAAQQEAAPGKVVMQEFQRERETLGLELEEMKQSLDEANNKLKFKEEMADESIRQLAELDDGDEQQNIRRMRYQCWPLQWLGFGMLGTYVRSDRDANSNSTRMELSNPLL